MNELFHKIAVRVSYFAGSPLTFMGAIFIIVFLIQNTQNRDARAFHLKLDELLKGVKGARAGLIDIEDLPDEELEKFHDEFKKLHEHYALELTKRRERRLKKAGNS